MGVIVVEHSGVALARIGSVHTMDIDNSFAKSTLDLDLDLPPGCLDFN
jgi:hypothetical protein